MFVIELVLAGALGYIPVTIWGARHIHRGKVEAARIKTKHDVWVRTHSKRWKLRTIADHCHWYLTDDDGNYIRDESGKRIDQKVPVQVMQFYRYRGHNQDQIAFAYNGHGAYGVRIDDPDYDAKMTDYLRQAEERLTTMNALEEMIVRT